MSDMCMLSGRRKENIIRDWFRCLERILIESSCSITVTCQQGALRRFEACNPRIFAQLSIYKFVKRPKIVGFECFFLPFRIKLQDFNFTNFSNFTVFDGEIRRVLILT